MKIGIMQPYFFPYLGYWQLINAVDQYVIYDDVAYIKGGWINRNQIKGPNGVQRIDIQVQNASQNRKINELYLFKDERAEAKFFRSLEVAYKKAPYYNSVMDIIQKIMCSGKDNLAEFLAFEIETVANYLRINTKFVMSSEIEKDESLKAQNKILDICTRLGGDTYINAIGGKKLYDAEKFAEEGIQLYFLAMDGDIVYPQGKREFVPGLSIIDVMMYNSLDELQELLNRYTLVCE